jgi:hypothetical protein
MYATTYAKAHVLPLRSKLLGWLEQNPQQVASAAQWLGMVNNLQSVRKEEVERSGISELLTLGYDQNERVPKKDLMAGIENGLRQCRPSIETHWKFGFRPSLGVKTKTDELPRRVEAKARPFVETAQVCYQHPSMGYWIVRTGYQDLATTAPNWIVLDNKGKILRSHERHGGWFPTALEAFDVMHQTIRERFHKFGHEQPVTAFDAYTFMGGKNYQEWFVCLPDWPLPYRDGHFELEQLLVHIRTTERMDCDEQPLFMVEEIQSPWHADGRVKGYTADEDEIGQDDCVADAPFSKEWHELGIKAVIWLAIKQGFTRIGFTTGKQQCERWRELEGLMNLYNQQIPKCLKKISAQFDCRYDWTSIITRKPVASVRSNRQAGWEVRDANNKPIAPPVKTKDVALFYLELKSPMVTEPIRVLEISPVLRQAVLAGDIPLFGW